MADITAQDNQELITALHLFTVSNICEVASVALLAYDHLITLPGEVQFVWGREFSGATVIFLLNRYVTLFGKILLPISTLWWPHQTDQQSRALYVWLVAVFSALRVYAIWNKDWRPFLLVLVIALSVPVTNMYHYIQSIPEAFIYPLYGCSEATSLDDVQLHSSAVVADLLVVILTWVKTYGIRKLATVLRSETSISALLLRDGTLYFSTMLLLNVLDLIILQSDVIFDPLPIFIDVFTCILISRFMLNLRQVARRGSGDGTQSTSAAVASRFSTVHFSPDVVGDLGAPLEHVHFDGHTVVEHGEPEFQDLDSNYGGNTVGTMIR
ncbi:hypothetical protein C8Q79DRAFT_1014332 [Trametes meyenii]|nr:hypothetical protein C8Q79DRAFT_1014332 [Trametes meyenii]